MPPKPPIRLRFAPVILCLATFAVYANALSGPFLYDDMGSIRDNASIRHLSTALGPPSTAGVAGRPLLNETFALNYVWGGLNTAGYHVVNVLLHAAIACLLFGLIRRALATPRLGERFGVDADWLALVVAGLWAVHPLATAAVDWISERAELLMAVFYLLTLYGFVRGTRRGLVLSVAACWLGGLSKEVIVTAPVVVLLFDRTFVAGSFRGALGQRKGYYAALAGVWLIVAALLPTSGAAHMSTGFGHGVSAATYVLTSCRSILLYLKLAFWPAPLVFYYGMGQVRGLAEGWPFLAVVAALVVAAIWASARRPAAGFAALWVFLLLAPTTSFVPLAQPTAEYRFYLPLAGVIALVVLGLYGWLGRRALAVALLAVPLGAMAAERNRVYASAVSIWSDTARKAPDDAEVRREYGLVLLVAPGRLDDAITELRAAAELRPNAQDYRELAWALAHKPERQAEAFADMHRALALQPNDALSHNALGMMLMQAGRPAEARAEFEATLRLNPDLPSAKENLAQASAALSGAPH